MIFLDYLKIVLTPITSAVEWLESSYAAFGLSLFAVFVAMVGFNYFQRAIVRNFL